MTLTIDELKLITSDKDMCSSDMYAAARTALELMDDKKKLQEALRLVDSECMTCFWEPSDGSCGRVTKAIADLKKEGLL